MRYPAAMLDFCKDIRALAKPETRFGYYSTESNGHGARMFEHHASTYPNLVAVNATPAGEGTIYRGQRRRVHKLRYTHPSSDSRSMRETL